jgi:hypothetical protein
VLETVKLFMDKKGCIFVIGAAGEIIEDALKPKYGEEGAGKFMDKIVQVTFNLPQARREDFERYLERIGFGNSEEVRQHLPLLIKAVRSNVRRLKRNNPRISGLTWMHGRRCLPASSPISMEESGSKHPISSISTP